MKTAKQTVAIQNVFNKTSMLFNVTKHELGSNVPLAWVSSQRTVDILIDQITKFNSYYMSSPRGSL